MIYKIEYDNGLTSLIRGGVSFLELDLSKINQEGLRSIASIPDKWDTLEDLQIRVDGLYENIHLVNYISTVKSSIEKQNE